MNYKSDNYLNKSIPYIISGTIVENDMKSAGLNIWKKHKLVNESTIKYLDSLTKHQRNVKMGLMKRDNKELSKTETQWLRHYRKEFIESNDLIDDDILSVKRDAIFTLRRCINDDFDGISFIEKNIYSSYYYIDKKEIYVGKDNIDIKGISDTKLLNHNGYMCKTLWTIFKMIETAPHNSTIRYLKEFVDKYKNRELPLEYYRELNANSQYRILYDNTSRIAYSDEGVDIDIVDINYNYNRFIIPIINLLI